MLIIFRWRNTIAIAGGVGVIFALLCMFLIEPVRGAQHGGENFLSIRGLSFAAPQKEEDFPEDLGYENEPKNENENENEEDMA